LATLHNLRFISNLMQKIKTSILDDTFDTFQKEFLASYRTTDEQTRFEQKQKWLKGRNSG
jgi:tRNA-guanine family transglycosylase